MAVDTEYASEIPSGHLPPVPYRDLPEPVPLRKITGASVIMLATSLGSGEFILWPYITSQVGLVVMWAAVVGFVTQWFLNMEIERYTLATGETVVTGFARLWKHWWWLFALMAIIPNIWPAWATGSGTVLTYLFDLDPGSIVPISITGLVALGIALTVSPVVYQTVEKIQTVMVAIILVFVVTAIVLATSARDWGDLVTGFTHFGRFPSEMEFTALLGALAFAGAGGAHNLVLSNWIRDKGLGMGRYIPKIASPITGEDAATPSTGFLFRTDEDNLRRWRGWWKVANQEQLITFLAIGLGVLTVMCVLTYSTVFGQSVPDGLGFLRAEGEALAQAVGPWFGQFFWAAGVVVLFSTNLGILDYVSRLTADAVKVNWLRESRVWSESRLYFLVVWTMIIGGSMILLSGLDQPIALLVIASVLAGFVMFIYSVLLIVLNRRLLPKPIRIRGVRLAVLIWSVLFFGFFSVMVIIAQAGKLLG